MQLNEPQQQAVLHTEGPLLVFAGAGSGKTRVITYRIANLIARGVPPYRILAVTFTNKAAGEMKERLTQLAGAQLVNELWVGTFHSICCRLLRRYHADVNLGRNFVIYDDSDQKALVTRILRKRELDERVYPPKKVLSLIQRQKQEGRSPDQVALSHELDETLLSVYRDYEQALLVSNAVDFDNLILHVMRAAESSTLAAGIDLRERFQYVLVDEFQDTNAIQYRLVRALASRRKNICVVGDDDQSIYSWRGADIRNIRGFRNDFEGSVTIKLEQNYRSTSNIVEAALGVISSAKHREPKRLWTESPAGSRVLIRAVRDEREEAGWVVSRLQAEIDRGVDADKLAVFYRINAQSRVFEEALRGARLPYQIIGGMRFFERAEVKDVMAYLRLLDNPQSDADLLRIINVPARGIGDKTVEQLIEISNRQSVSLWDAFDLALGDPQLATPARKKLQGFQSLLNELRANAVGLCPADIAREVLTRTGYRKLLSDADTAEADARLENIEELVGSLMEYEVDCGAAGEEATLTGYLERVSLVADIDAAAGGKSVLLMTVHSAKGLEFDSVYLTGMEEEVFPYRGLDAKSVEELEEERRLAYVAITRARARLQITYAGSRTLFGQTRYLAPSRFLADIPEAVAQREGRPSAVGAFGNTSSQVRYTGYRAPRQYNEFDQTEPEVVPSAPQSSFEDASIDYSAFDDLPPPPPHVRAGARVLHERFGKGTVRSYLPGEPPKIVALFSGWGEKKVLASSLRYL